MGNQRLLVHLDTRSSNQIDRKMSWQSYVDEQLIPAGWSPLPPSPVTMATSGRRATASTPPLVRGKKGSSGVHIYKTSQAVIIACYSEPIVAEQCAVTTEKLGDYLVSVGY